MGEDQEVMGIMAFTMDNTVTVEGLEVMEIMDLTMEIVEGQEVMVIMDMVTVEGLEAMVIMDMVTVEGQEVMETAMEDTTMEIMALIMEIMATIMGSRILFKCVLQYTAIDKINIV